MAPTGTCGMDTMSHHNIRKSKPVSTFNIPLECHTLWLSNGILNIEIQLEMDVLPLSQAMGIKTQSAGVGFVTGVTLGTRTQTHAGMGCIPMWVFGTRADA